MTMPPSTSPLISDCGDCPSRSNGDLCNLEDSAAREFRRIRRTIVYQPGQFVFYEGHAALALYILGAGRVKLTRSNSRGQQRVVGIMDPGQLIEKHILKEGVVHQVTCEALEPSQVCVVDRAKYFDFLEQNSQLAVKVIKLLSHEMGVSLHESDQLAFASARERIAGLLIELGEKYGEPTSGGSKITLQLKREELAKMAALTVETGIRILKSLQASKLIRMNGREITILQSERLAREARKIHFN